MLDRFTSMAAFVAAADTGSFAAAAVRLRMSAQMVAKHVLFLEDRLGARLLNRTTRRQSLTDFGRRYYEQCKVILAEVTEADRLANEATATPRGLLRITAPVTFGNHRLVPLVTRFLRENPEVKVDLALTDRCVDMVEEGFEVALRTGPLSNSNLMARSLAPCRFIACAAPSYLDRCGEPIVPEDLRSHECLGFLYWSRPADDTWTFTRGGESCRVRVGSRLQANSSSALLTAALEGYGIALGSRDLFRQSLSMGWLRQVLPEFEGPCRPLHLLYVADRRQTPKVSAFIRASVLEFERDDARD